MSRFNSSKPLIVILGPTGSGKTELSIKLCQIFGGEVVNADSRQIYKGMDIGTAKPVRDKEQGTRNKEQGARDPSSTSSGQARGKESMSHAACYLSQNIPHHLIDIVEPDEEFSLVQYQKLANQKIKEIWEKGKIPFLVGGAGLYIDAVVYGYQIPQGAPDRALRKRLEKESNEELFKKLQKLDPKTALTIDKNNKRRLIRTLEVCLKTKKPFSAQQKKNKLPKNILIIGLDLHRQILYQRIDRRVDKMIKRGLVKEVRKLVGKYSFDLPAMSGIGYKEISQYLQRKFFSEEAIEKIKFNTHGFARRQLTWFRKNKDIKWISYDSTQDLSFDSAQDLQKEAKKLIKIFLEAL